MVLLQRAPAARGANETAPRPLPPTLSAPPSGQAIKPWVGVVVPTHTAELAADTEARIAQVFVRTGARVAAGDALVQFDLSDSLNAVGMANAQLGQRVSDQARAQARVDAAQSHLARLRSGATWLSADELEQAAAELRMANADLQSARAAIGVSRAQLQQHKLHAQRRMLTAPFDGTVIGLDVDPGDSVTAGQVVMRILSDGREVRFASPPGELPETGERWVMVRLDGTNITVNAQVASTRPEVDPSAQLVIANVPLPKPLPEAERFLPGAPVQVYLAPPHRQD